MKLRWPPSPLGVGAPLNLVALSAETRPLFGRSLLVGSICGLTAAIIVVGLDRLLFAGVTVQRLPDLGAHPPLTTRVLIVLVGSVGEELFFRVFVASIVAWLAYLTLSRLTARSRSLGQWLGILIAAGLAGVWHVGSQADAFRVLTIGGVVGITYGWLYWWRGLESAIMAHMIVTAFLYIAAPAIF
jgi:hypothetical protein